MEVKKTVSMFFSIAFIGTCVWTGPATASERGLALHGRMVNAGCDAHASFDPGQQMPHPFRVNAQITLDLSTISNACAEKNLPLVARYVEQSSSGSGARTGVVTLTYQ